MVKQNWIPVGLSLAKRNMKHTTRTGNKRDREKNGINPVERNPSNTTKTEKKMDSEKSGMKMGHSHMKETM